MADRREALAPAEIVEAVRKDTNFVVIGFVALIVTYLSVLLPAAESIQTDWRTLKTAEAVIHKLNCEAQGRSTSRSLSRQKDIEEQPKKKPIREPKCDAVLGQLRAMQATDEKAISLRQKGRSRGHGDPAAHPQRPAPKSIGLFKNGQGASYRIIEVIGDTQNARRRTLTIEEMASSQEKFSKARTQLRARLRERTDLTLLGFSLKLPFTLVAAAWLCALAILTTFIAGRRRRFYRDIERFNRSGTAVTRAKGRALDLPIWLGPLPWARSQVDAVAATFHPSATGRAQQWTPPAALTLLTGLTVSVAAIGIYAAYVAVATEPDGTGGAKFFFQGHRLEIAATLLSISSAAATLVIAASFPNRAGYEAAPGRRALIISAIAATAAVVAPMRWVRSDAELGTRTSAATNRYRRRIAQSSVTRILASTLLLNPRSNRVHAVRRTGRIPGVGPGANVYSWKKIAIGEPLKDAQYAYDSAASALEDLALAMISMNHLDTKKLRQAAEFLLANINGAPLRARPRLYDLAAGLAARGGHVDLLTSMSRSKSPGVGPRPAKWRAAAALISSGANVANSKADGAGWLRRWHYPLRLPWRRPVAPRPKGLAAPAILA